MLTYLGTGDFWMTLVSGLLFHENNYMMSHSYDAMGIMIFKPPTTKQDKVHVCTVGKNGLQNFPIVFQKNFKSFINFKKVKSSKCNKKRHPLWKITNQGSSLTPRMRLDSISLSDQNQRLLLLREAKRSNLSKLPEKKCSTLLAADSFTTQKNSPKRSRRRVPSFSNRREFQLAHTSSEITKADPSP